MFWNGSTAIDGLSGNGSGRRGLRCQPLARLAPRSRLRTPIRRLPMHPEGPDRSFDVLQRQATQILERRFHSPGNGIADVARNQDAACRRFPFQPRRHVDAVAIEVVAVDDQVAQVQAHAEHESSIGRLVAVGLGHGLLKLDGGAQRINCAGELDQSTVAGQLDQTSSVFRQDRIEVFRTVLAQARQRPALVTPHQAGVADNVCSNDCRQFALLTRQRHSPWIATESVGVLC